MSRKQVWFDVDGVLSVPEELFSEQYSKMQGIDVERFSRFFGSPEWKRFVVGKDDLKRHIVDNPEFWHWRTAPEELLALWFDMEDVCDERLLDVVKQLRSSGYQCYAVAEQEEYRTEYIRTKMLKGVFDDTFSTSEVGYRKSDRRFYESVMDELSVGAADVIFFDDSPSKVAAAASLGMDARLYTKVDQVEELLQ